MTPEAISEAAAVAVAARAAGGPFGRLPEAIRPAGEAEGYAIQGESVRRRVAAGQALAGWKIGCTSRAMQEMLGLDGPSGGAVMEPDVHRSPARLPARALCNPVAECELAVRMACDVEPREGGHDRDSIADFVGACLAAIELAELRLPERESMGVGELIADDFFQKAVVLGDDAADWRSLDLAALKATTRVSGAPRGEGSSGDVMGHPFAALAWLADSLASRGGVLRAGQIALTGSIVKAVPIAAGDVAVCSIEGLGDVSLTLD